MDDARVAASGRGCIGGRRSRWVTPQPARSRTQRWAEKMLSNPGISDEMEAMLRGMCSHEPEQRSAPAPPGGPRPSSAQARPPKRWGCSALLATKFAAHATAVAQLKLAGKLTEAEQAESKQSKLRGRGKRSERLILDDSNVETVHLAIADRVQELRRAAVANEIPPALAKTDWWLEVTQAAVNESARVDGRIPRRKHVQSVNALRPSLPRRFKGGGLALPMDKNAPLHGEHNLLTTEHASTFLRGRLRQGDAIDARQMGQALKNATLDNSRSLQRIYESILPLNALAFSTSTEIQRDVCAAFNSISISGMFCPWALLLPAC